ncbi:MAG: TIGR02680 family protein, partial [Jiangellaceae bacterium]
MTAGLPEPARSRWQPLRCGLVDLFYYDVEEFWFRDGRLLLRGNNGTGKSKVLALTLPFLLDGDLSPHRVEPDADPKKRMEWNLLLGGDHPHPERLGYTWLEFGRRQADGTPTFRTLGCGLKAVSGRGVARHWFFLTDQRIGPDLALVDATRTALTRERLADALTGRGAVYDRAHDYRRAVDEALFGLGGQRYAALVDLLVQLRQPQLSKRPNERALSAALTEALPPLDQAVVADVAEAFRGLEDDRAALQSVEESSRAASSFLAHYRRYAGVASRRRAALPRRAQVAYETVNRNLGEAQAAYETAQQAVSDAEAALLGHEAEALRLRGQDEALRASPEMRSARDLDHAAETAEVSAQAAERLDHDREQAAALLAERDGRAAAARSRADEADSAFAGVRAEAMSAAATAHVDRGHAADIDARLTRAELVDLRAAAGQLADRQQRAVAHVRQLSDALIDRRDELAAARRRADELAADAAQLADERRTAAAEVGRCGTELVDRTRRHVESTVELSVPDPGDALAALELWIETLDGANPARSAVDVGYRQVNDDHARAAAALGARRTAATEHRDAVADEIARLEAGEVRTPPVPHTRDGAGRSGRRGAPLWRLVDFAGHVHDDDRAGVEAAMEAAGILDAWVTLDGDLLAPGTDDVVVRAHADLALPGVDLRSVLRPAVDRADARVSGLADSLVDELLAAIGLGAGQGSVWVAPDGRFRVGVLEGAWRKPAAEFIGSGAREAARRARLVAVRADLAAVECELAEIDTADRALTRRRAVLAAEVAACPDDVDVRAAHADVAVLTGRQNELDERQARAAEAVTSAKSAVRQAEAELTDAAAELSLPVEPEALAAVRDGLSRYREALAALWPAVHVFADARRQLGEADADVTSAGASLAERTELASVAGAEAAAAQARHRALMETVGAAVADLQSRLGEVREQLRRCEAETKATRDRRDRAINEQGVAEGRRVTLHDDLERLTAERVDAAEALRRFAATGLLSVAVPDLAVPDPGAGWAPNPTVLLAREIERALADVPDDDDTWQRVQRRVDEELKTL